METGADFIFWAPKQLFSHCCKSSRAHIRFPKLGIQQRDWEPTGNLTSKASGIWLQIFHRTGEIDSWRAQTKPCAYQNPEERCSDTTRDWARLACECPGFSSWVVGWQWPDVGSRALNTTVLACLLKEGDARRSLVCLPLPGKVTELFFSTSPKTLSPGFDLASMYREAELFIMTSGLKIEQPCSCSSLQFVSDSLRPSGL